LDAVLWTAMAAAAEEGDEKNTPAMAECTSEVTAEQCNDRDAPAIGEGTDAAVVVTELLLGPSQEVNPQVESNGENGERLNLVAQRNVRIFLRGIARLQEHHLQDYFGKFAEVVEVNLVRDKKTQRPRGMAFLTLMPRATLDCTEKKDGTTADALVEKLTGEDHSIDGVPLEIQEALPNPKDDAEEAAANAELPVAGPVVGHAESIDISTEQHGQAEAALDPAALEHAQAQWKMHYLAMAINASVPEVGHLIPKQMPVRPDAGPTSRQALDAPGAVPKAKVAPKAPLAPWRRKGPYAR